MCVCVRAHLHTHVHVYVHICVYMHMYMCMDIRTYTHIRALFYSQRCFHFSRHRASDENIGANMQDDG